MKAILYARFSPRPNAAECESCDAQLSELRRYAEGQGWEVVDWYQDADASGADENRTGLEMAVKRLRRGYALLVTDTNRLARDNFLAEALVREIQSRGACLATADGILTRDETDDQWLLRSIRQIIGEYQRRAGGKVTSNRMLEYQRDGRCMGGIPYGWQRGETITVGTRPDGTPIMQTRLVEDPEEQATIARARELRTSGLRWAEIARRLHEEGRSCRGRKWHHETVARICGVRRKQKPRKKRRRQSNGHEVPERAT